MKNSIALLQKKFCKQVNIVMLTSSTLPDAKKKAENYTCVIAYLEKPLTKEKVEEIQEKGS